MPRVCLEAGDDVKVSVVVNSAHSTRIRSWRTPVISVINNEFLHVILPNLLVAFDIVYLFSLVT